MSAPVSASSRTDLPPASEAEVSGPSERVRVLFAFATLALVSIGVVFALLSDQAPRFALKVKNFLLRVGGGVESTFGIDWFDKAAFPGAFEQGVFGGAMLVLGLTFRR